MILMLARITLAAALAASVLLGGVAPSRAQESNERSRKAGEAQQQQPPQKPARPDEDIDDDDVVRVETDLTNVLFTAVDKNKRFVTTLRKEDVRVLEDGVPQEITAFQR